MDDALLGFMQRIREIGQGVTAYTVSRLQTHSLISNTVQLWYEESFPHSDPVTFVYHRIFKVLHSHVGKFVHVVVKGCRQELMLEARFPYGVLQHIKIV